tara:strand:- start:4537 stop:5715 length:1179 start_codon:yes stop_codon:yes gene_type:complete
MPQSYVKRILDAQVYDVARETPIHEADLMSRRLGNRVLLKREDLQLIFSFKLRGAYCKMSRLTSEQRRRGVIAASAGNHAQVVAMAAKKLRVKTIIVMPRTTPQIKREAVRRLGARVLLHGDSYDEAVLQARDLMQAKGMTYVHPFDDPDVIAEPAGALALAGLKKCVHRTGVQGQDLLAIVSGANTNFDRLRYISERTKIGEQREAIISVTVPERPGTFKKFCSALGRRSITEFNYRYADANAAQVFVGLSIAPGGDDLATLLVDLRERGYTAEDMTDNEVAKSHVRHMVGGHAAAQLQDERVYRVEFPECPGALLKFLSGLGSSWNISMFHYRNHGAAYGRIFIGVQARTSERKQFEQVLDRINFKYSEETNNPAYKLYLGISQAEKAAP